MLSDTAFIVKLAAFFAEGRRNDIRFSVDWQAFQWGV
jgi:hypothetical protein